MEIILFIVVGYFVLALLNSWSEHSRRLRCGAREGLFGKCTVPVSLGIPRCPRHTGLPKRRWP